MGLKPLLACLLLSALALSGCADDGDGDDTASTTSTSSRASPSPSEAPTPNQPPTGSISLSTEGGSLPLAVNITLTGSDPEGGNLTWTLAFGDGNSTNGVTLPANLTHNYTAAGTFTIAYTLSDGEASSEYNATLNVTEGAIMNAASQQASGSWTVSAVACPHVLLGAFEEQSAGDLSMGADVTWGYFEVDSATWGATWTLLAEAESGNPTGEELVELDFYDTAGVYMEYTGGSYGAPFSGTVPDDAGFAFVFPCSGPGSFQYTATFP